jgi:putative endonuclease
MTQDRRDFGKRGESEAARFLGRSRGMRVLAENYFARSGEVDLVMMDGDTLVFVEVKKRASWSFGDGEEAVTPGKRRRIVRAAMAYVAALRRWDVPIRFDVVIIEPGAIRHYASAFVPDSDLTYY